MKRNILISLVLCVSFCIVPAQGIGQIVWTETSTIGYGAAGCGLGLLLTADTNYEAGGAAILVGSVSGLITGFKVGRSAERSVRAREDLSTAKLVGVRFGTVACFATLGTLSAAYQITSKDDNAPGDDEKCLRRHILIGAAAGVVVEAVQEKWIRSRFGTNKVQAFAGPTRNGGVFLGVRLCS